MEHEFGNPEFPLVKAHRSAHEAGVAMANGNLAEAAIHHGKSAVYYEQAIKDVSSSPLIEGLRAQRQRQLELERYLIVQASTIARYHEEAEAERQRIAAQKPTVSQVGAMDRVRQLVGISTSEEEDAEPVDITKLDEEVMLPFGGDFIRITHGRDLFELVNAQIFVIKHMVEEMKFLRKGYFEMADHLESIGKPFPDAANRIVYRRNAKQNPQTSQEEPTLPTSQEEQKPPSSPEQQKLPSSQEEKKLTTFQEEQKPPTSQEELTLPTSPDQQKLSTSPEGQKLPTSPEERKPPSPPDEQKLTTSPEEL